MFVIAPALASRIENGADQLKPWLEAYASLVSDPADDRPVCLRTVARARQLVEDHLDELLAAGITPGQVMARPGNEDLGGIAFQWPEGAELVGIHSGMIGLRAPDGLHTVLMACGDGRVIPVQGHGALGAFVTLFDN